MDSNKYILLTIDVEDWFQVENFKSWIPFESWDQRELRVEKNVHRLLDLFDSIEFPGYTASRPQADTHESSAINHGTKHNRQQTTNNGLTKKVKCTFFVLGWIAERLPHLVREIQSRGHEIASHGYNHALPNSLSPKDLKNDLTDSKKRLEDTIGESVIGYRAPSFAINDDILKILDHCGYQYDSSYNSFSLHGRYGKISLNGTGKRGVAYKLSDNFYELSISNLKLKNSFSSVLSALRSGRIEKKTLVLPWGGGAYFRLIPLPMFNLGINSILQKEGAYLFYMHPWEIDPDQPHVREASTNLKFRHYTNLRTTHEKLFDLINDLSHCRFITCSQYLEESV